ncbi:type II toxin-antitoxin system Phd/YefM family antitoxin [Actinomyces sp.]|uniref:type II toxin-antitoxin system Phd/YefM family antitoxin n=1 Tax=Actinomyces sp. TaxID=29317 RepID=UPI0026DD06D8|nr:type II toxin-antitoxin system Phd/YefM family antitoxin [Actinomyces sp.]MDO4899430.1 type II toxin-antitoxin system Phd/YefM family antitoxin [Actinomyces sp.]
MKAQPAVSPHGTPAPSSGSGPAVAASTRTVSLRELNQRSGRIVADVVSSGRPVTITDRGRPVVRLVPIAPEETPYERLLREGLIQEATHERTGPLPSINVPNGAQLYADFMAEREEER